MSKTFWNYLLVSPTILGASLLVFAASAAATVTPTTKAKISAFQTDNVSFKNLKASVAEQTIPTTVAVNPSQPDIAQSEISAPEQDLVDSNGSIEADPMDQITNVSQLRDVRPGDWAYEALRELVERYGCIAGYPNGTYRGNRTLTRYEFAAGLKACLQQVEKLIAAGTANAATKEDLATIRRLADEFTTELAQLRAKVDALEARTAELEANQFSTTTKLTAEVVTALTGVVAGENAQGEDIDKVTALGTRLRLNLDTSFTGKDLLRTRLQVTNLDAFSANSTLTPQGDLRFSAAAFETGSNEVALDALLYSFPIGEKTTVVIEANAGAIDDFTNTINAFIDGDGGSGALSHFATRNPIYYLLNGAGIGLKHEFSDKLELSLGYLANSPADPSNDNGIFNGPYGAMAQLTVKPSENINVGLTYIHSYNTNFTANGSTGSNRANLRSSIPPFVDVIADFDFNIPTSNNAYGIQASWQVSPKLVLGGWAGYTATRTLSSLNGLINRGDLKIWNWAVTLAAPDLGKKGSLAGIVVGMEPRVTAISNSLRNNLLGLGKDPDTSLHIEGFYQYQLTDNITITPGIIWLTAPDHNKNNDDAVIGVIRTTLVF